MADDPVDVEDLLRPQRMALRENGVELPELTGSARDQLTELDLLMVGLARRAHRLALETLDGAGAQRSSLWAGQGAPATGIDRRVSASGGE